MYNDSTIANAFGGTFAKPHQPTLKPSFAKEPPSQRTKTDHKMTMNKLDRQEGQLVTLRRINKSTSTTLLIKADTSVLLSIRCSARPVFVGGLI
jgi:hypothetical protein